MIRFLEADLAYRAHNRDKLQITWIRFEINFLIRIKIEPVLMHYQQHQRNTC